MHATQIELEAASPKTHEDCLKGIVSPATTLPFLFVCCREDIVWTLQTLNPNALELSRLWHEHGYASAVRLLDVSSPDLLERLPVKVCGNAKRWGSSCHV